MLGITHKWNTRKCIRWTRHTSWVAADHTNRFVYRFSPVKAKIVLCPVCNAWHLMSLSPRTLGPWTEQQYLANLPPLWEPEAANTMQHGPNLRENRV